MKILAIAPAPNFSVADVHRGWVSALRRAGHQVLNFDTGKYLNFYEDAFRAMDLDIDPVQVAYVASQSIAAWAYEHHPDLVLITSGFFVPPQLYPMFRAAGSHVVLLVTEAPYEDAKQIKYAPLCDVVLLNDPTNLDAYAEHTRAVYVPHAHDPAIHHPRQPVDTARSDFAFVGTGYPSRIRFFEAVDWTDIDLTLAGNWQGLDDSSPLADHVAHDRSECCDNTDATILYASTKASANLYRREGVGHDSHQGWSMGPREVELAACGTFFLREARPESDQVLSMLPTFDGPEDFEEKLRWWLAHDTQRQNAATRARAAVADRTFDMNVARLMQQLPDSGDVPHRTSTGGPLWHGSMGGTAACTSA